MALIYFAISKEIITLCTLMANLYNCSSLYQKVVVMLQKKKGKWRINILKLLLSYVLASDESSFLSDDGFPYVQYFLPFRCMS